MAEEITINDDLIEKLMKADPAFMYKFQNVKDKLINNMNTYADSIKLNKNGPLGFKDQMVNKVQKGVKKGEGVFEEKASPVIIDKISSEAQKQIISILKDSGLISDKKIKDKTAKQSASGKFIKDKLNRVGAQLLTALGMKNLPSFITSLAKGAGAMAPIMMIAGGIIWMAIDGIKGFMMADKWGVSKISGMLGGLLGGMDSGLKGALKGMGKWALIGAGIGSIVPVVGTITGGLIGAAIGGILGWIGGERIAKAFDRIGEWFNEKFNAIINFFGDLIQGFRDGFWNGIGYFFGRLTEKFVNWWNDMTSNIENFNWSDFLIRIKEGFNNVINGIVDLWNKITGFLGNLVKNIWEKIKSGFKKGQKDEELDKLIENEMARTKSEEIVVQRTNREIVVNIPESDKDDKMIKAIKENTMATNKRAEQDQKNHEEYMKTLIRQTNATEQVASNTQDIGGEASTQRPIDIGKATEDAVFNYRSKFYRGE